MFFQDIFLFANTTPEFSTPWFSGSIITIVLLIVWPLWLLCRKLGINPWMSLLIFVPIVNLFLVWIFYFTIDKRRKY
jgi:hypothetical protein